MDKQRANDYLHQLQQSIEPTLLQAVSDSLVSRSHSIQQSLSIGTLNLSPPHPQILAPPYQKPIISKHLQRINQQRQYCKKELQQLQQDFSKFGQLQKQLKQNRLESKKLQREMEQHHQREFMDKAEKNIQRWNTEKVELHNRKKELLEKQRKIEEKIRKEKEEEEAKREEERKKQKSIEFQEFKKEIQARKKKREEVKKIQAQKHHEVPMYIGILEKFKSEEEQYQFQMEVLKKKQKSEKYISFSKINDHQKSYIQEIKKKNVSVKLARHEKQFTLFKRTQEKSEEKQKQKKRSSYQTLLKKIPIEIDDQKKLQTEIIRDKAHNPLKYVFLGQKGLNEFQIFAEFKDFQVQNQQKKLGDQYLTQQKQKHKERLENLRSLSQSKQLQSKQFKSEPPATASKPTPKPRYPNYLPSLSLKKLDQIQTIVRNRKDKTTKINTLIEKSQTLQSEALKKIQKMHTNGNQNYKQSIKAQDDVDKLYLQSLKAKLACAELAL